jgi:flagellar biogenesis protein FliO
VAIVGLAVIGPLALIALLAWLVSRVWMRRSRERTLGESP